MRRLAFRPAAGRDVRAIARYIAEQSDRAIADALIAGIKARCERLADLPGMLGTARPALAVDLRSTPYKNHVIYSAISTTRSRL